MEIIYLAWGNISERTKILSKLLNMPVFVFRDRPPYIKAFMKTLLLFLKMNPNIVILQTTQGPAVLTVTLLKYIKRFKLVFDIHPNFLVYTNIKGVLLNSLFKNLIKYGDVIVLHDYTILEIVPIGKRPRYVVLIDPPPLFKEKIKPKKIGKEETVKKSEFTLVMPSGTISVENIRRIVKAFANCDIDVTLYITGPHRKRKIGNVVFTGFLSSSEYIKLLLGADLIVSWINRQFTVTRSSLEAAYLKKPLIVPDTNAFRKMFKDAAIYLSDINEICSVLKKLNLGDLFSLETKMSERSRKLRRIFNKQLDKFKRILGGLNGKGS